MSGGFLIPQSMIGQIFAGDPPDEPEVVAVVKHKPLTKADLKEIKMRLDDADPYCDDTLPEARDLLVEVHRLRRILARKRKARNK